MNRELVSEPADKVLLVDDREENLLALEALLRAPDVELHRACSGREALELLLRHDFALALVDVQMPEMDGYELATLMRGSSRTRRVPIIFVTAGSAEPARIARAYEAGGVDFLAKPIDPAILRGKVEVFLQLHRVRREIAYRADAQARLVGELRRSLQLAEAFMAVLAHDLRNPLGAVLATAETLLRRSPDERTATSARRIVSSSGRMARLIEQMLEFARVRLAGSVPLALRDADAADLCRRAAADVRRRLPSLEAEISSSGSPAGRWDPDRLVQAISNLVANAARHGAAGAPVHLHVEGRHPAEVTIEVANEGAIDPDLLPRLFDPFRPGGLRSHSGGGLGVGLYIVEQIVLAHGGTVEVESSAVRGTRFAMRLPRTPAVAELAERQAAEARHAPAAAPST